MKTNTAYVGWAFGRTLDRSLRRAAFSLVELLTVIFIISLLIAILIPSLNGARNAAKKTSTGANINAIKVALETFRTDNERDFPQTHGYPPSFAHPKIGSYAFSAFQGEFPFLSGNPVVYGAHWLPAMLLGRDGFGYINRSSVPEVGTLRNDPDKWYQPVPPGLTRMIDRQPLYMDIANLKLVPTYELGGSRNDEFFQNWTWTPNPGDNMIEPSELPVITDPFGQPILYYAANNNGRITNMLEDERNVAGVYGQGGPPVYFHQDNRGFTGTGNTLTDRGWDFTGQHTIAFSGAMATAVDGPGGIEEMNMGETFAKYILDKKAFRALAPRAKNSPLRPMNPDSYLLISGGVDGRYGTRDDVTNFPLGSEN